MTDSERGFFEPRFGMSFPGVRLHDDTRAAELAGQMNARAFAIGRDVVLGKNEYAPDSLTGRRLLAHELTHVVQQSGGTAAPFSTIQRKPKRDKKAEGRIGKAIEAQKIFWTDLKTSSEPGAKRFADALTGSSYDARQRELVKTIDPTNRLEIRLNEKFRTEPDRSVRLKAINAEVRKFKSALDAKLAKAKKPILTTFKLKSIVDGNASWTVDEISLLNDALTMVPAADRSALEGVEIRRVISVGPRTKGLFESEVSEVAKGTTTFTEFKVMKLANGVFSAGNKANAKQLIIHEVAHAIAAEKRHKAAVAQAEAAVEQNKKAAASTASKAGVDAAHDEVKISTAELNAKILEHNKERDPTKKAELRKQVEQLRAQDKAKKATREALKKQNKADISAENAAAKTTRQKAEAVAALTISAKDLKSIKASASTARKSHDRKRSAAQRSAGSLAKTDADVREYHDAVFDVSSKLESFHDDTKAQAKTIDEVDKLVAKMEKSIAARDAAKSALSSSNAAKSMTKALGGLVSAQDGLFHAAKAHALAHKRTRVEQDFAKFVTKKKIAPITPYAAKNWPHRPGEFYAEAYSFWVTGKLKAVSADLQGWFDAGKHK